MSVSNDLENFNIILYRSGKDYKSNQIKFMVDIKYSKIEITQIIEKLFKIKVNKITTAILPGKVKMNIKYNKFLGYTRIPERKIAVIETDFEVEEKYRKIEALKKQKKQKYEKPEAILEDHKIKELLPEKRRKILELSSIETIDDIQKFLANI